MTDQHGLGDELRRFARSRRPLVVCDYDGSPEAACRPFDAEARGAVFGEGDVDWREVFGLCESIGGTKQYVIEEEGRQGPAQIPDPREPARFGADRAAPRHLRVPDVAPL